MTRKMAYIGFSYLLGLFVTSYALGYARVAEICVGLLALAAVDLLVERGKRVTLCACVISFAAGGMYYSLYSDFVYENIVKYDGYDVAVEGKITALSDYSKDMSRYEIKGKINGDVTASVAFFAYSKDCSIGDNVTVLGKAAVFEDDYLFPAKSYYKAKGVYLQIEDVSGLTVSKSDSFSLKRAAHNYREAIYSRMSAHMSRKNLAVMSAILFGDKSGLESDEKTLLQRAGIGHIMAVSGAHLGATCSFFWWLLSFLPVRKSVRFALLLLPLGAFVLLAGMTNSVNRAALMIVIVYASALFKRRADALNSLGIAVVILTISNPFAVRDASFLLSAAGVFGVAVLAPIVVAEAEKFIRGRKKSERDKPFVFGTTARSFISCACVLTVIFPVSFLFFDEVSVISPLTNVMLMPVCMVILICGVIVTFTGALGFIAYPALLLAEICCEITLTAAQFIGGLRFSYIPLGYDVVKTAVFICLVTVVLCAVFIKSFRHAMLVSSFIFGFTVLTVFLYRFTPSETVTAAVLRDGTASVLIIHDKHSASIVDLHRGGRAAKSAVKYLNRLGIYDIEAVYLNVNSATSQPIYLHALSLFDVGAALVPEGDYLRGGKAGFGAETYLYDKANGARIEMPYYALELYGDNTVALYRDGNHILTFDGADKNVTVAQSGGDTTTDKMFRAVLYKNGEVEIKWLY